MDEVEGKGMLVEYRRYWIPVFLLPTVMLCSHLLLPNWAFAPIGIPLFFGVFFYSASPYLSKRASYSYWMMVIGLWMAGAIPAFVIGIILGILIGAK